MKTYHRITSSVTALVVASALAAGAWAQQSSSPNTTAQPRAQGQQSSPNMGSQGQQGAQGQPGVAEGFVVIQDNVVYVMAHEPQNHFVRAIEDLRQNDNKKAGEELEIAANYIDDLSTRVLREQAMQQSGQGGQQAGQQAGQPAGQPAGQQNGQQADQKTLSQQTGLLSQSADRLRTLGRQIQSGNSGDPQQLTQELARANLALASFYQTQADRALQNQKQVKAGHELEAAALSYRQSLIWSNQSPEQTSIRTIQDAKEVAASLVRPSGQQSGQAAQGQTGQSGQQSGQMNSGGMTATGGTQDPQQVIKELASQIQQLQGKIAMGSQQQPGGSRTGAANER